MQFTPQQLVGAGRYAPSTRIGNWNEDLMLEEARARALALRRRQGSLLATHKLRLEALQQRAPRSFDASRRVRFSQAVGVRHAASGAALAANVFEETPTVGAGEFLVTALPAAADAGPTARTTFRIVDPGELKLQAPGDGAEGSYALQRSDTATARPLTYGEPFFLACNEALLVDTGSALLRPPLLLKSGLKTDRSMSPITYRQRVWLGAEPDSAALWVCARADLSGADLRLAHGSPVLAGDALAVVHKMTGQPLCADAGSRQPTDFGPELEVSAAAARGAGKLHHLAAEAAGERTGDTEGRAARPENAWVLELAPSAELARDERALPPAASPVAVLAVIQQCLAGESLYAFRRLVARLLRLDAQRGSGHLDRERVKWLLAREYQLPLRDEQLDLALDAFDKRHAGFFPADAFLKRLRLPLSAQRAEWVNAAFDRLTGGDGALPLSSLVERYDPSVDARVRGRELSAAAATAEYRELWLPATALVSRREFLDVYTDVSAVVAHDAHFAQLLDESWA